VLVEVVAFGDAEAEALEDRRDIGGVVARIGELYRVLIGRIADHQGDTPVGKGRGGQDNKRDEQQRNDGKQASDRMQHRRYLPSLKSSRHDRAGQPCRNSRGNKWRGDTSRV
jgi:hypothetical protein